ncbi:MAG: hypothetical protein QXD43_02215 [Candidatus Aenigmatarchaeota archaeon]
MSYRWIISPDIVEIHTEILPIKGFAICKYNKEYNNFLLNFFNFYANYKYYFKIRDVKIPKEPDARYQYYFLKNNIIYYIRKIGPLSFIFSYNLKTKTIIANRLSLSIPFELGQIWPIGLHLSNIIALDLLLEKNILFIHGASLEYDQKTILIFSPSRTGKTLLVENLLKKGAKYISEDIILTDGEKVYLLPPNDHKFFNANIKKLVNNSKREAKINKLLFIIPKKIKNRFNIKNEDTLINLLKVYSKRIPYDNDKFIHAILYFQNLNYVNLEKKCYNIICRMIRNNEIIITSNPEKYFE